VVTLSGPLSAGKTTLVRGLLGALGHSGEVPSPSFSIVQPYEGLTPPVWHVDLYRIENASDINELGLDDIRADGVLIVEWPEHAGTDAWPEALALSLEVADDGSRALTAKVPAAWEGRWPPQ
jgi:tRNA threonylcarbamoyladenosine biosynthesis protein TsaE